MRRALIVLAALVLAALACGEFVGPGGEEIITNTPEPTEIPDSPSETPTETATPAPTATASATATGTPTRIPTPTPIGGTSPPIDATNISDAFSPAIPDTKALGQARIRNGEGRYVGITLQVGARTTVWEIAETLGGLAVGDIAPDLGGEWCKIDPPEGDDWVACNLLLDMRDTFPCDAEDCNGE